MLQGTASYYTVKIGGEVIPDAAWYYPEAKAGKAKEIEGYVAFYKVRLRCIPQSLFAYSADVCRSYELTKDRLAQQNKVKIHE